MNMDFTQYIKDKVKLNLRTVILPEYRDDRMYFAAEKIIKQGLAKKIIMCGDIDFIHKHAKDLGTDIEKVDLVPIEKNKNFDLFVNTYFELRKHKNISIEQAHQTMKNELYFGAMMVRMNEADGMVAGAMNTTADLIRAAIQVVGPKEGIKTVSSFFVMIVPDSDYGEKGLFLYADCGVVADPTEEELADIGIATAESMRKLFNTEPRIAFLSFSTKGSASHSKVEKVVKALALAKSKRPDLIMDGELQGDAALEIRVAKKKAGESQVAGKANVLIFPDLDSGNISYKLTQYLAKAEAYGPILQGLAKPVNDLSRGCLPDDIVSVACITQLLV